MNSAIFFKEKIFDFSKLTSWNYYTQSPDPHWRFGIPVLVVLTLLITAGFVIQWWSDRRHLPIFYRRYLSYWASTLIYPPFILLILALGRLLGIEVLSRRIIFAVPVALWLILILLMVCYRIVILKKKWREYRLEKREQEYQKNAYKNKR